MKKIKYSRFLGAFILVLLVVGCGSSDKKTTPSKQEEGSRSEDEITQNTGNDKNSSEGEITQNTGNDENGSEGEITQNTGNDENSSEGETTQNTGNETTPPPNTVNRKKTFESNWIDIESGASEKIDKDYSYPIKRLGDNFIEVTKESDAKHIFLRDGSPNGVVRGQLYSDIEHVQKFDVKRGKNITFYKAVLKKSNAKKYKVVIDDGFNRQSQMVLVNGKFSFSGVTTGSVSKISIIDIEEVIESNSEDNEESNDVNNIKENNSTKENNQTIFETEMPIVDEDTDLGNFQIPDKNTNYNFKTSNVIDTQDKDDRYMYESRTFTGKLTFVNSGTEMATALNYEITTDDAYVEELTHDIVMGSVEAGASIEIPFKVTFRRLDKIAHRVKLDFMIRDFNGKEWLDHVYLDVYQTPVTVNLKTKTSNLKGYFITPEHEIISMDTKDIKVRIPSRPDASYYFLVVSPKDIGAETAYSMGIDVNSSEFDDFHDTSAFEPNNLEESASKLEVGDSIKSFIHKGDIDFFTIDFKKNISYEPPRLPFN